MKRIIVLFLLGSLAIFTACENEQTSDKIVAGFGVGTYEEQFREGIVPILEEQGYEVEIKVFSQNMQVNPAMAEGAIDVSIFQSTAYMEAINEELGINMTALTYSPSAPQSLHSVRHDSLDAVEDGSTIALPNDPVNQERAVRILEELGWVTIADDAGTVDFNLSSVSAGDYDLEFVVLDPAQILVSLEDVDFGIINGNYIADAGMRIADGLAIEDTPDEHRIIVSILEEDLDEEWAQDLKAAIESPEFEAYMTSQTKYDGFILPGSQDAQ
ncbi:methionine ABC transporter substrate-binding protein [Amphibacillus sp. MSJ-3]|uniref:MetQ/NlpA family ABC transporter substrate-binding protein n=1 Tax=Amphibacillus sp. MSJ-3 TaxID=2841505 RepID=UPI001C0F0208|nr:MetQ/NlpA family ABC transporter substrate-binding protein [Amphibacillus sp. MSJ-3]MBU5594066.1 methionine ABC transporter substrate-binding protein [Amphibacillus sp. MSJ-3]